MSQGSLDGSRWTIQISDPQKYRPRHDRVVIFDIPVAPGLLFTDQEFSHDLHTVKTIVSRELGPTGTLRSEVGLVARVRKYIHFVRWRTYNKIYRNSDLTAEWINQLLLDLKERGVAGLVPSLTACISYSNAVLSGKLDPPIVQRVSPRLDLEELYFRTGFSNFAQFDERSREVIRGLAKELDVACPRGLAMPMPAVGRTESAFGNFLTFIPWLWKHREDLAHDQISFKPFGKNQPYAIARSISVAPRGRTQTVPSQLICSLIDHALHWVHEYGPQLLDLKVSIETKVGSKAQTRIYRAFPKALAEVLMEVSFPEPTNDSPWPMQAIFRRSSRNASVQPTVEGALFHLLPAACLVVIAAFSARRVSEIESLRRGSCQKIGAKYTLASYAAKTLRDIDPIPVPASVFSAISLLEKLVAPSEPFLFEFNTAMKGRPSSSKAIRFHAYKHLKRFAKHVGIGDLLDEGRWEPKPHEFRRFFAVVYFNRFRFPHLTALSVFLRHNNLQVTREYYTEVDRGIFVDDDDKVSVDEYKKQIGDDFREEYHRFKVERVTAGLTGEEFMGGWGGLAIKRRFEELKNDAQARVEFTSGNPNQEPTLSKLIDMLANSINLEPHSQGHSYCKGTNRPEDIAMSACANAAIGKGSDPHAISLPVMAEATPSACTICPLNVQFSENESYWRRMQNEISVRRSQDCGPILERHLDDQDQVVRNHLNTWFSGNPDDAN